MSTDLFTKMGEYLNDELKSKNYEVAPRLAKGKPGSNDKTFREYRLQLINKNSDTSAQAITHLRTILGADKNFEQVKFNEISPNSSKFPSFSFTFDGQKFDIIIARGANNGEKFELKTVKNLDQFFKTRSAPEMRDVVVAMNEANEAFASREIVKVEQRTGKTQKAGIPIEKLGEIIGDIVLTDSTGDKWYVSLKDVNGNTFSSYSGAASLFNSKGDIQPDSEGAKYLEAFGVDLNLVQAGFDERAGIKKPRKNIPVKRASASEIEKIFQRGWGMNYFYVRRQLSGWKIFWLDRAKLNKLCQSMRVDEIKYPGKNSKQITIKCSNAYEKYIIELRNSKRGEYPNDTKMKLQK